MLLASDGDALSICTVTNATRMTKAGVGVGVIGRITTAWSRQEPQHAISWFMNHNPRRLPLLAQRPRVVSSTVSYLCLRLTPGLCLLSGTRLRLYTAGHLCQDIVLLPS